MAQDVSEEKSRLRKEMLEKLRAQTPDSRHRKRTQIVEKIREHPEFQRARVFMFYISTSQEVETRSLLEYVLGQGRTVAVPRVVRETASLEPVLIHHPEQDLAPGSYGILEPRAELSEPLDLDRLDLILVPGIAFDRRGHRLGRGKGYYDRLLKRLPPHVKRFGLAFDFQLLPSVPASDSDASVDRVITNG